MTDNKLKEMFVEMCKYITKFNNEYIFLRSTFEYDEKYDYITTLDDYDILISKMYRLLYLINQDEKLIDCDIEDDIWHRID